ncbi:LOB domain-containing protein 29-like [Pistacia vera]|uniref:LOB domain-containing protein 29-like n=1 Tax=Pistacia vera TaxID=55513 RepID=UPI00126343B8|nr:LOB domain-containing protein 29-like [Pistacia vera]XP_031274034.1 LOB domain-containing protein 29-like [Pistacia vera]
MTGFGSSCGACKFLRRRCTNDCIFAPYFCYEQAASHFAAVHKVFGASNVSKLLFHLPVHNRSDAAITISYEALARMRDPIYGCVAQIFALQQQVASLQEEIELLGNHMAANQTVGVASSGSSQAPNELTCSQSYFSPYPDAMNTPYYQNQQAEAGQLNHGGNINATQAFDTQMNVQIPSINGWEEQNILRESSPDYLQRFLEEMDQQNFAYYPWLDTSGDATN